MVASKAHKIVGNMKKLGFVICFILSSSIPAIAWDTGGVTSANAENYFSYGAVALVLLLFIAVIMVLLRTIRLLSGKILIDSGIAEIPVISILSRSGALK
jgi:hypothetical protein